MCVPYRMGYRFRMGRCSILFFLSFVVLVLYKPVIDKLHIAYIENVQIRKPLAVDRTRHFDSTCNRNADGRGHRQKVIAYSVYGDFSRKEVARRYLRPLKETVQKIHEAFPGKIKITLIHELNTKFNFILTNRLDCENLS